MLVFIIVSLTTSTPALHGKSPQANVTVGKKIYVKGEPIEIVVSISSSRQQAITIASYPTLGSQSGGLRFSLTALKLHERPSAIEDFERSIVTIPGGEDWKSVVFLQRFLEQPEPGKYELPFLLSIPYRFKGSKIDDGTISAKGKLVFEIQASSSKKLEQIFRSYKKKILMGKGGDNVEALCVVDDPLIIPYLKRILVPSHWESNVFNALSRFAKNKEAEAVIIEFLDSDQVSLVIQALGVLTVWKYELPRTKARELLHHRDPEVQKAAKRYVEALGKPGYPD